jgi:hypothetical protein
MASLLGIEAGPWSLDLLTRKNTPSIDLGDKVASEPDDAMTNTKAHRIEHRPNKKILIYKVRPLSKNLLTNNRHSINLV